MSSDDENSERRRRSASSSSSSSSDSSDDDMDPNLRAALAACAVEGTQVIKQSEDHAEKVRKRREQQKRDHRQPNLVNTVTVLKKREGGEGGSDSDDEGELVWTEQLDPISLKIADMLNKILDRTLLPNIEAPPSAATAPAVPPNQGGDDSGSESDQGEGKEGQPSRPRTKEEKQRAKKERRRQRKLALQLQQQQQGLTPQSAAPKSKRKVPPQQLLKELARQDPEVLFPSRKELRCTCHVDDDGRGVALFRGVARGSEVVMEPPEQYVLRWADIKRRRRECAFEGAEDESRLAAAVVPPSCLPSLNVSSTWDVPKGEGVEGTVLPTVDFLGRVVDEDYPKQHGVVDESRYHRLLGGKGAKSVVAAYFYTAL